jgi:hypothetical protein
MAIVPLPLPPNVAARALLHHLLEHGDVVGKDTAGQTIIQLSVPDYVLETLMTFDAEAAELEDGGDGEPDADDEEDGLPVVVDLMRPKMLERRRAVSGRLTSWHGAQRSSSRCTGRSCRAFPWTRRTSTA